RLALLLAVAARRLLRADREYLHAELGDTRRSKAAHGRLLEQLALLCRNVEGGARDRLAHSDVAERPCQRHPLLAILKAGAQGVGVLLARLIGAMGGAARHEEQNLAQFELGRGGRRLIVLLACLHCGSDLLLADLQAASEFPADDRAPADV